MNPLMENINRQMRNTSPLSTDGRSVKKCDKGTQTKMIRLSNREVQTETMTELRRPRENRRERSSSMDRWRERRRCYEWKRSSRPAYRRDSTRGRWDRGREHDRLRERERDRRVRHRETRWSPDASPVHSSQRVMRSDRNSDTKLSQMFRTNRKDRYFEDTTRSRNRTPDASRRQRKDTLGISDTELWDTELPEKKKGNIVQSDDIETPHLPEFPQSPVLVTPPLASPQVPSSETVAAKRQKVEEGAVQEESKVASSETYDVDHDRSSVIVSESAESKRKRTTKMKGVREAKRLEGSYRNERKKKHSKNGVKDKFPTFETSTPKTRQESINMVEQQPESVKLNEGPKLQFDAKSKKEKLMEIFGSDNDDVTPLVRPKESIDSRNHNVHLKEKDTEDATGAEIQRLESSCQKDISNHEKPPPTDVFVEDDSLEDTTLKDATSAKNLASTLQDQPQTIDASLVKCPVGTFQQDQSLWEGCLDQISAEASQHNQLPVDVSTAKPFSPHEILPLVASPARTFTDVSSQQLNQIVSPAEVVVFSNKYSEYHMEDNNDTETTIYITRKKKKKCNPVAQA